MEELNPNAALPAEEEKLRLLRQIAESQRKQEKFARLQYTVSIASACACLLIALVLLVGGFYVRSQIKTVMANVNEALVSANEAIEGIQAVTETVKALDLKRLTESVTTLAEEGTRGVNQALDAVDSALSSLNKVMDETEEAINKVKILDIDSLNRGISKLNEVLEPLARFFNLGR